MSKRLARLAPPLAGAVIALCSAPLLAQPTFGNTSPTAGSETSQRANDSADQALYRPVEYVNKARKGPAVIVIPGEFKCNNATLMQNLTANKIADFGERLM
jgi:hypothetical protein